MPQGRKTANPRKPKPSDLTAKYRKRLKRRIARLDKLAETAGVRKTAILKQRAEYADMLAQTYQGDMSERRKYLAELEQIIPARSTARTKRSDAATIRRLREMNESQQMNDMIRVKVFWQATKDLWRGAPREERATIIKRAYGTNTLGEAYDIVMTTYRKQINDMETLMGAYDNGIMSDTMGLQADAMDPYDVLATMLVNIR